MGIQVDTLVKGKDHYGKEFIDFEFDGKHISDFGMVAVFDGDRHTFSSTSEFEDETSEVAGVHGQYFWGTKLKPLEKEFSLATDGMTERQVNEFKQHFQPGRYGKFIECATSNRWRWARIAAAPEFKVVPFKKEIPAIIKEETKQEDGKEVTIKTTIRPAFYITEYKGEATIKFVFDNPYSYAVAKQFDCEIAKAESWQLKVAYEDGIPFSGVYIGEYDSATEKYYYKSEGGSISLYNPSNVASVLNFKIIIKELSFISIPDTKLSYIASFKDEFNALVTNNKPYSTIVIKDAFNQNQIVSSCSFAAPDVFYSYNKIIKMTMDYSGTSKVEFSDKLREEITHMNLLNYALGCLNNSEISDEAGFLIEGEETNEKVWKTKFNELMKNFFSYTVIDEEGNIQIGATSIILTMNGDYNTTTVSYSYLPLGAENSISVEENCGEIVRTPYLKLNGGNGLTEKFELIPRYELALDINYTTMFINFEYTYI